MMEYNDFLKDKIITHTPSGFTPGELNPMLFDWQKILITWALKMGKAALFEDCGLGKTPQQLEWANQVCIKTKEPVLILAPLAVSKQTQREGEKFGIDVNVCNSKNDVKNGINITNYQKLHKFDPLIFSGVVLDESSILKNFTGKIKNQIIDMFAKTEYKLCATATPSPNDFTEIGNTAEFLNVMTRPEMLAMFFINDTANTGTWRLKGHVTNNVFWRWLSSWAVMMQKPSDIGFKDEGFELPELKIIEKTIKYKGDRNGLLFVDPASTLTERRDARRESMEDRVKVAASIVNRSDDKWLVWCNMNNESKLLKSSIKDAVEVTGSDKDTFKESAMIDFQLNKIKCLVTKPSIAGLGMNWQNCFNVIFVGLSDSYEQYYQAIRRCWRFGQTKPVKVYVVIGEREGAVVENIKRKEADMQAMFTGMLNHINPAAYINPKKKILEGLYRPSTEMQIPSFMEA